MVSSWKPFYSISVNGNDESIKISASVHSHENFHGSNKTLFAKVISYEFLPEVYSGKFTEKTGQSKKRGLGNAAFWRCLYPLFPVPAFSKLPGESFRKILKKTFFKRFFLSRRRHFYS